MNVSTKLLVSFTRDDEDWTDGKIKEWEPLLKVEEYLNQDPRNAIHLHGLEDDEGKSEFDESLYVLRGAGEGLKDFYWGVLPAEDPNDAEGVDLTAGMALAEAVETGMGG